MTLYLHNIAGNEHDYQPDCSVLVKANNIRLPPKGLALHRNRAGLQQKLLHSA